MAKAGAIVPMASFSKGDNAMENPETLEIYVFPGGNNRYELYEDKGDGFEYEHGQFVKTEMKLSWTCEKASFTIRPTGDFTVLPSSRRYVLHFRGFGNLSDDQIYVNEDFEKQYDSKIRTLTLALNGTDVERVISVSLEGVLLPEDDDLNERVFEFLDRVQGSVVLKDEVMKCFHQASGNAEIVCGLQGMNIPESWRSVLIEMTMR